MTAREHAKIITTALKVRKGLKNSRQAIYRRTRMAWLYLACTRLANEGRTEDARDLAEGIFFGAF